MTSESTVRVPEPQPRRDVPVDAPLGQVRARFTAALVLRAVEGHGGLDDRRALVTNRPRTSRRREPHHLGRQDTCGARSHQRCGGLPERAAAQPADEVDDVAAGVAAEAEVALRLDVHHEARVAVLVKRAAPDQAVARAPELNPGALHRRRDRVSRPDRVDVEQSQPPNRSSSRRCQKQASSSVSCSSASKRSGRYSRSTTPGGSAVSQ